jgi:hypothetical protein
MSRVRRYSRSGPTAGHLRSPTGLSPPAVTRSSGLRLKGARAARRLPPPPAHSSNPPQASPAGYSARGVWAPPRSLAATEGILSVPRGTEMFQFPRCPLTACTVSARPCAGRVAPFGHPRITGCQRLPGAFRRVAASFVGRQRQGIHHAPIMRRPSSVSVAPRSPAGRRAGPDRLAPAGTSPVRLPPGRHAWFRTGCNHPPTIRTEVGPSPPVRVAPSPAVHPKGQPAAGRHPRPGAATRAVVRRGVCRLMCVYFVSCSARGRPNTSLPTHHRHRCGQGLGLHAPLTGGAVSRGRRTSRVPRGALSRCRQKPFRTSGGRQTSAETHEPPSRGLCRNLPA